MHPKTWVMLKVLLNRYHSRDMQEVLYTLDPKEAQAVLAQDIKTMDLGPAVRYPKELLQKIHYSWLLPLFRELPSVLHSALLGLLPQATALKVGSLLHLTHREIPHLAPQMAAWVMARVYQQLAKEVPLPTAYLTESPMSSLTACTGSELTKVIDFLGLYDLAEEMRHTIDKKRLQTIQNSLDKKRLQFVYQVFRQSEKVASPRLDLTAWDGSAADLEKIVHKRGIIRFSKALSGQHPDLIWHIAHLLDVHRGTALQKAIVAAPIPGVTPALRQQVFSILQFLELPSHHE